MDPALLNTIRSTVQSTLTGISDRLQVIETKAAAVEPTLRGIVLPVSQGLTWTNMPAALDFLNGSHAQVQRVDLSAYTQVRLVANKQGVAGGAGAVLAARYFTSFTTVVGNYLVLGTGAVQVAVDVTDVHLESAWVDLAAGARADVFVGVFGSGSDGAADPVFGAISLQFR